MTKPATFTIIVEGRSDDPLKVAPHAFEYTGTCSDGEGPPELITLPGGQVLIQVGKYASAGNRWGYRVVKRVAAYSTNELPLTLLTPAETVNLA